MQLGKAFFQLSSGPAGALMLISVGIRSATTEAQFKLQRTSETADTRNFLVRPKVANR
jgi:hypothetical protein